MRRTASRSLHAVANRLGWLAQCYIAGKRMGICPP